jgi:DNA-binding transcriptional MocR family regulator
VDTGPAPALGPRYIAIAEALADDAGGGRLRAGTRLPTHRDLADRLGVTVGTITAPTRRPPAAAWSRERWGGDVRARGRAAGGGGAVSVPAAGLVDLSANLPPAAASRQEAATLARTLAALSKRKDLGRLLAYPPEGGAREHREAGAEWIRRGGYATSVDRVLVTSGSQHGMTSVFAALFGPGDVIATEALTYPGMKALAGLLALRLHGVAMDVHGLRPDAFAAACRARRPKALYCVPTLQNPTTAVMPASRRQEIAAIAREHGVLIVEDDVHGRLLARPHPPLSTFAPDNSVYVTGTSKVLAPGLRVGFTVAPPALGPRIAAAIRGTTWMAAPLMAEIASRWIHDGTAETILARKRKEAAARYRIAKKALEGFAVQAHPEAYHLWLPLPKPWRRSPTWRRRAAPVWPSRPRRLSQWAGRRRRKRCGCASAARAIRRSSAARWRGWPRFSPPARRRRSPPGPRAASGLGRRFAGAERRRGVDRVFALDHARHLAVLADHEGDAVREALLLVGHAVGLGRRHLRIGQQREGEGQALRELLLRLQVVRGDAEHLGRGVRDLRVHVAEVRHLLRAAAREGLGKKARTTVFFPR